MATGFNSQVGQQDYLSLLTVQLRYQDPLDPVDQETMLSQLSQFSMLEGVENLNNKFESMLQMEQVSQAAGMIGKKIAFIDDVSGDVTEGIVKQISLVDGELKLAVGESLIAMSQVSSILYDA